MAYENHYTDFRFCFFFFIRLFSLHSLIYRTKNLFIMKEYLKECMERAKECIVLIPFIILPLLCWGVAKGSEVRNLDQLPDTVAVQQALPIVEEVIKEEKEEEPIYLYVRGTVYNPTEKQCGSNPSVTADGKKINHEHLNSGKIRWVAVSKDLLQYMNYGDKIYVHHSDKKIAGVWEVHDLCGIKNTVDFLRPWPDTLGMWRNIKIEVLREKED